jgi:hypothetical protein
MNIQAVKTDIEKSASLQVKGVTLDAGRIALGAIRSALQCRAKNRKDVAMRAFYRCISCCRELAISGDNTDRSEAGRIKQEALLLIKL